MSTTRLPIGEPRNSSVAKERDDRWARATATGRLCTAMRRFSTSAISARAGEKSEGEPRGITDEVVQGADLFSSSAPPMTVCLTGSTRFISRRRRTGSERGRGAVAVVSRTRHQRRRGRRCGGNRFGGCWAHLQCGGAGCTAPGHMAAPRGGGGRHQHGGPNRSRRRAIRGPPFQLGPLDGARHASDPHGTQVRRGNLASTGTRPVGAVGAGGVGRVSYCVSRILPTLTQSEIRNMSYSPSTTVQYSSTLFRRKSSSDPSFSMT